MVEQLDLPGLRRLAATRGLHIGDYAMNKTPLLRFRRVFSSKSSRDLWKAVGAVRKHRVHDALYAMGCHCQQLEVYVHTLEARVAELERRNP